MSGAEHEFLKYLSSTDPTQPPALLLRASFTPKEVNA